MRKNLVLWTMDVHTFFSEELKKMRDKYVFQSCLYAELYVYSTPPTQKKEPI